MMASLGGEGKANAQPNILFFPRAKMLPNHVISNPHVTEIGRADQEGCSLARAILG